MTIGTIVFVSLHYFPHHSFTLFVSITVSSLGISLPEYCLYHYPSTAYIITRVLPILSPEYCTHLFSIHSYCRTAFNESDNSTWHYCIHFLPFPVTSFQLNRACQENHGLYLLTRDIMWEEGVCHIINHQFLMMILLMWTCISESTALVTHLPVMFHSTLNMNICLNHTVSLTIHCCKIHWWPLQDITNCKATM